MISHGFPGLSKRIHCLPKYLELSFDNALGNPNGAAVLRRACKGGAALRLAVMRNADRYAQNLSPVVADIKAQGDATLRALSAELNTRGELTRRGGSWHVPNARNLPLRIEGQLK